jgi:hypothetical protein
MSKPIKASGTNDVVAELKTVKSALELAATKLEGNSVDIEQLKADLARTQVQLAATESARVESALEAATTKAALEGRTNALLAKLELAATQTGAIDVGASNEKACIDGECAPHIDADGSGLLLAAPAGGVRLESAECGSVDLCEVATLVQQMAATINTWGDE